MSAADSGFTVRVGPVLESLYRHPLARRHRWRSLGRFLRWELLSRVRHGAFVVDFVGHAKLWVERGMTCRVGVGSEEGTLGFTTDAGPMNRVIESPSPGSAVAQVPVTTLDVLLGEETPRVVKVDVEGFETEVVAGADRFLARPGLLAVVMEQNGAGARYGHDESRCAIACLAEGLRCAATSHSSAGSQGGARWPMGRMWSS